MATVICVTLRTRAPRPLPPRGAAVLGATAERRQSEAAETDGHERFLEHRRQVRAGREGRRQIAEGRAAGTLIRAPAK